MSPEPRKPGRVEQALRDAKYVEPVLPPAPPVTPAHIHDLCLQAAAQADKRGVHGTQPETVTPPATPGTHSVLLGCLVVVAIAVPWFVGVFAMVRTVLTCGWFQ